MSSWGQGSTRNWRKIRQQVLERDSYECQLQYPGCLFMATEVDHAAGLAAGMRRGGEDDDMDLCRAVCGPCHKIQSEKQKQAGIMRTTRLRAARLKLPQQPHPGD